MRTPTVSSLATLDGVHGDPVRAVRQLKEEGGRPLMLAPVSARA